MNANAWGGLAIEVAHSHHLSAMLFGERVIAGHGAFESVVPEVRPFPRPF